MLKIKIFVFVICISNIHVCASKYCEICPEHTLCRYKVPGPSPQCIGYDTDALLSEDDRNAVLDKINERRNFIAIGRSRLFPTAANMKKLMWSNELATFAQRWVNQCDQSLRPDRKDICRDLDYSTAGQSIATITGSSPHYNIKSFVEMWFMESMDYTGSVTYYNKSQDHKTNDFTQLIWANTAEVGCGKAKFFVNNVKPIRVDRLVCNFAPSANVDGAPVYTVGRAATQCDTDMERDITFSGLCSHRLKSKDAIKRSYPFKNEEIWNNDRLNYSTSYYRDYIEKREKGHSRVYHGHEHRNEFDYLHPETVNQNARRYDYPTTSAVNEMEQNYRKVQEFRKHNINQQCTRKSERIYETSGCPCKQRINQCTRGQKSNCRQNSVCQITTHRCKEQELRTTTNHVNSRDFCSCNPLSTIYQVNSNRCAHTTDCECISTNCPDKPCAHMLRTLGEKLKKENDFQYYDVYAYISQPSTGRSISKNSLRTRDVFTDENPFSSNSKHLKSLDRRKKLHRDSSDRKRSVAEEESFKPFWQMDEFDNKNEPQLKSLKYTTILNKKRPTNKRTKQRPKTSMKTESITVVHKEHTYNNGKRLTEKYLSFDELMHLRKNNADGLGGRRNYDDTQILRESNTSTTVSETTTVQSSPTTEDTSEYSFNTPFIRMKFCTRKLTCTWTAASLTDSAGSIIPGGGGNAIGGSRTPPGYVEGCTRTSTCTRDYMHRNKMATLPVEATSPDPEPGDDEDYCERRSLNRRSNFNLKQSNHTKYFYENVPKLNKSIYRFFSNSNCNEKSRRSKRQDYIHNGSISTRDNMKRESKSHLKYETNLLSYGDLYYYVVRKIIEMRKITDSHSKKQCLCNGVHKIVFCNLLLFLAMVLKIYFNTFW